MFCVAKFSSVDCHSVVHVTVGQIWFQVNFDLAYNHGQKSSDTFAFLGYFPINTGPTPPLTPQKMLDEFIQNFFPSFNFV